MLPNLSAIETHAGRIVIGATVRSTRYCDVQGLVTAIYLERLPLRHQGKRPPR